MRRWPQGPQFQLELQQSVQTSSSLGYVFATDNIGDVASIATTSTRVEVSAFVEFVLACEAYLSFTERLMLTFVVVVAVAVIGAFS